MSVILGRFVTRFDAHVTEAANAEEALAALDVADFDLIVSDYSMPGRNGIDLLAAAQQRTPRTARMLITALGQLDIGVEAINRGKVDAFLRKPWDNAAFVALVDSLLEPRVKANAASHSSSTPPPSAQRPPARAPAPQAPPRHDRGKLESEMQEIDHQLGQLRVRLGLGSLSPEGYSKASSDLTRRRALVEIALLKMQAA